MAHLSADGLEFVPAYGGTVSWDGHAWRWCRRSCPARPTAGPGLRSGDARRAGRDGSARRTDRKDAPGAGRTGRRACRPGRAGGWVQEADAQFDRALALLDADDLAHVQPHIATVREELAKLATAGEATLQRVHGDYHVGQVLMAPAGLRVIDFEGEPTKSGCGAAAAGLPAAGRGGAAALARPPGPPRERDVRPGHLAARTRPGWTRPGRRSWRATARSTPVCCERSRSRRRPTSSSTRGRSCPSGRTWPIGGMGWLMGERAA